MFDLQLDSIFRMFIVKSHFFRYLISRKAVYVSISTGNGLAQNWWQAIIGIHDGIGFWNKNASPAFSEQNGQNFTKLTGSRGVLQEETFVFWFRFHYRKTSYISRTLVGNEIVDNSDVVGASPVGAAPTTSSFWTWHLASMDWAKTTAREDKKHLSFWIWCDLY